MPPQRIVAQIGGRETIVVVEVPSRHFTDSDQTYNRRKTEAIEARMRGMGASSWEEGYSTEAASADSNALQQVLRARRGGGDSATDLRSLLNPRRAPHRRRNRYRP